MNKKSSSFLAVVTLVSLLFGAASASAANLVVNGNFASGFDSWMRFGNAGYTGTSEDGGKTIAYLGPIGSDGFLTQVVPTIAGRTYTFSFLLKNLGGTVNDFTAGINFDPVLELENADPFDFTTYMFNFVAEGPSMVGFAFRQDPSYFYLTDVSVSEVPLPAALPLFGAALAGLAAVGRKKKA
jgi:hypothetical protein